MSDSASIIPGVTYTYRIHTIHEPDGSVRFTVIRSACNSYITLDLNGKDMGEPIKNLRQLKDKILRWWEFGEYSSAEHDQLHATWMDLQQRYMGTDACPFQIDP
jgi:hypothetical protein